jgi:outer membrane receptor for ferrienterochelin and colicin
MPRSCTSFPVALQRAVTGRARGVLAVVTFVASLFSILAARELAAQEAVGRITGRVIDAETGQPVAGVGVQIVGTTLGAMTGVDGRYLIVRVPAGTVTLQVRRIGYAQKTITGIVLAAGGSIEQDVTMEGAKVELTAVTVSAASERGSVSAALDAQRKSVNIVNAITSEQIAKSPDGDAAQAVQRVSGVSVQDGKYVFVRGLGERYTQAALNGARIPSPEPERKVVPLDLFPSGLLQTITTAKTFTPDLSGDFSGALVNIQTREFPARRTFVLSQSVGVNTAAFGADLPAPITTNRDLLALGADRRRLPSFVRSFGSFDNPPSQDETNLMVNSFRNRWTPRTETGSGNTSTSASLGGSGQLFGMRTGYLISGTYAMTQEVRADQVRALALAQDRINEVDRFEGQTGRNSALWGGLLNLSVFPGSNSRLTFNGTYNRTMDNDARAESGRSENLGLPFDINRLRYVERAVQSSQLAGEHEFGRHKFEWAGSLSGVERLEPDRSEIVYIQDENGGPSSWFSGAIEGAVRTFSDLTENAYEGRASYQLTLGEPGRQLKLKTGGLFRSTERTAGNFVYQLSASRLAQSDLTLPAEAIFDGRFTQPGMNFFTVRPFGTVGGSYRADDRLAAGFAMFDWQASDRVQVIGGARLEMNDPIVTAQPTVGAQVRVNPRFTDLLPSLAVTYRLSDRQNLRVSGSRTLARPEYRELAPIQYREVIGFDNVIGNESLVRTLITNADVRWELYPSAAEVLSVSVFAKQFTNPIERVYLGTSGTRVITFQNARGASNLGVELETRTSFGRLSESLAAFSVFTNATLMRSDIQLDARQASVTRDDRPMIGQSPYVVNAGLTWSPGTGATSATVLFNVVGKRITDAGEIPLPDVEELPRNVLDLSLRFPFAYGLSARVDAKNLLDAPFQVRQGPVTREFHRFGRVVSVGFSWQR